MLISRNVVRLASLGFMLTLSAPSLAQEHRPVSETGSELAAPIDRTSLDAIGRLSVPGFNSRRAYSTVTHLGQGLVLSAGHVLSENLCKQTEIEWGLRATATGSLSRCQEVLHRDVGRYRDIIIFRVAPIPPAAIDGALIEQPDSDFVTATDDQILLLGHPLGEPLMALYGRVQGFERRSSMLTDLMAASGDSGAPIFHLATGRLIGIHSGREGGVARATWLRTVTLDY